MPQNVVKSCWWSKGTWLGLWCLVTFSCASGPAPLPDSLPPLEVETAVESFYGPPLSQGDVAPPLAEGLADTPPHSVVRLELLALHEFPWEALAPLGEQAALISAGEDSPLLGSSLLTRGARLGRGQDALHFYDRLGEREWGPSVEVVRHETSLTAGRTVSFPVRQETDAARREFVIEVYGEQDQSVAVALRISYPIAEYQLPEAPSDTPIEESPATRLAIEVPTAKQETVLLRPVDEVARGPLALVLPTPFAGHPSKALVAFLEVTPPDAVAGAEADVQAPADTSGPTTPSNLQTDEAPAQTTGVAESLAGLGRPASRRPALLYLANAHGALLCGDLALAASDEELATLAGGVEAALTSADTLPSADVGWTLEHAIVATLAAWSETGALPMAFSGVLLRHAGQIGTDLPLLAELADETSDMEAWRRRLEAENGIFLESSSPAARQRAFDWLATRGKAPVSYDPLASPLERRKALAAAREEPSADIPPPDRRE